MFLSRLMLNPKSRLARADLANPHELHKTLLAGFPKEPEPTAFRAKHGVLYRVEIEPHSGIPRVLLQSLTRPDWQALEARPGYLLQRADCKDIASTYSGIREGQVLSFRLRVNATVKTKRLPDGTEGKPHRVPLRTPEEQTAWLQRKAEAGGFELVSVSQAPTLHDLRISGEQDQTALRDKGKAPMTFAAITFDGRLKVRDPQRFVETIRTGIGSAKAYGFGLLSVRPG